MLAVAVIEAREEVQLSVAVEVGMEASRFTQLVRFLSAGVLMGLSLEA